MIAILLENVANLGTAVLGALAAYFWWKVAVENIPASKGLTADMTNFDWLTTPLAAQARNNKFGAAFAALGAALQVVVALLKLT
ncbi:hypothetical protein [Mesorhizobium caraganae]|uniref:hypothetical protein n=1 Tax=Mesorhizobium caraganae TaxID=483206 RepID=UPI00333D37C7